MNYHYILSLIVILSFGVFTDASAQRKVGTKKRQDRTTQPAETQTANDAKKDRTDTASAANLFQRLNSDIKVGNVGFSNNIFSLSLKANSGYKLTDNISAGLAFKYGIQSFNAPGQADDFSIYDIGGGIYARAKILQQFYVQVEYDINNVPLIEGNMVFLEIRETIPSAYFGGGYLQGWGNWKFGAEILFIMNNEMRDYRNSFVEYWLGASHNF